MIKHYVLQQKGITTIAEVEVRAVSQMEDPSIVWRLQPGEAMYHIVKPKPITDGTMGVAYMYFAFYESEVEAREFLERGLRTIEAERAERHGVPMTEAEILEKLGAIKFQPL